MSRQGFAEGEGPITRYSDRTTVALRSSDGSKKELSVYSSIDSSSSAQNGDAWTGRTLWPSGAMLAFYFWQIETASPLSPLRVLELACGSAALPGLALTLGGRHHCTFADLPTVIPLTKENVSLNARQWEVDVSHSVAFMEFDWAAEVPEGLSFDLIIGSDIVFAEDHIQDIRRWLRTLLTRERDNPVRAVIAGENRSGTFEKLMQGLSDDGVTVKLMDVPEAFARFERPHPYSQLELRQLTYGGDDSGSRGGGGGSSRDGSSTRVIDN